MLTSQTCQCMLSVHQNNQQWRHSSFGNYYVHNIVEKKTRPVIPPSDPPRTAYATWSPTGSGIAFVTDNDIYVLPSAEYARSFSRVSLPFDNFLAETPSPSA